MHIPSLVTNNNNRKREGGKGNVTQFQKSLIIRIILAILLILFIYLIVKLFPVYKIIFIFIGRIMLPFIVAAFISYLLYPIVMKIHERFNLHKGIAVFIIYLLFFGGAFLIFYRSFPLFVYQLQDLSDQLPQLVLVYEDIIYSIYESTSFLPEMVHEKIDAFLMKLEATIERQIEHILDKAMNIFDFIIVLTIIPVLVFYFLKDFTEMRRKIKMWIPKKYHIHFEQLIIAIDKSFGGYVRGQLIISTVVIFLTYIVYYTFELKYALVLAVLMGFMNIIPYFGPVIGTIPAVAIALTTSWNLVIVVLITTVVVQILEGSFLSPYVMGKSVQIHPSVIILTLLIGAEIGGIIGMIFAVPTVTILKAIIEQLHNFKTTNT